MAFPFSRNDTDEPAGGVDGRNGASMIPPVASMDDGEKLPGGGGTAFADGLRGGGGYWSASAWMVPWIERSMGVPSGARSLTASS